MKPRAELPVVALAMIALAMLMTWPLAGHLGTALPSDLADPLLNTFTLAWDADRFAHGLKGLWDAPFFFPQHDTLAFSEHLLGIAVFTAPVQWATGNAVLAYNLAFLASYALAGFCAYLLARSLWGSRTAAWVAGLAFSAAPHRAMHVSHLQVLMSGWLPLGLWALHRYFASRSRAALAVFAVSFVLLALSCSYLMFYGALPIVLVILVEVSRRTGRGDTRVPTGRRWLGIGGELASTGVGILLVLAPVAAAYLRVRAATGLRRGLGEMTLFSAQVSDFWRIPAGLRIWADVLPAGLPERMLFPGLIVVLLAVGALVGAGVTARRRTSDGRGWIVALYGSVLALSGWLAFGPRLPGLYGWLAADLPGFDALRVPSRFIVVATLALALLAGRGAAWIAGHLPRMAALTFTALVAAVVIGEGYAGPVPLAPFDARQSGREALNAWLRAAPAGGLLELPVAGPDFAPFTTTYQFNTLLHGHPVVNGYSGTGYGLQDFLADPASPLVRLFEVPDALRGLRQLGVRYLVLHRSLYEQRLKWSAEPLVDGVDVEVGQIASRVRFGDTIAWRLVDLEPAKPNPADSFASLHFSHFSASASHASGDARLAFDGDLDSRWSTGGPQRGDEWFALTFARDIDVGRLVFQITRFGHAERPHHLVVESEAADGSRRVLFDGSIVPQMMAGIAAGTSSATVMLPPNSSRVLRLRQTGHGGRIAWSIAELSVQRRF
jgi:hypothetical protein